MPAGQASGFYGKLPCRGDFMQRRVAQEFVDVWDAWLQESLHATRERLGERWLEAYLTSPVWRFVFAEGVCGGQAHAGVMVPSVDRVGRYFPLAIVAPLASGTCLLEAACGAGRSWFDSAESLALRALEAGDLDLDAFDAEVEALEALDAFPELARSSQLMELMVNSAFTSGRSPWHVSLPGEVPQRAANVFASIELERVFRPCALWWTQGSEAVQPGWLVSRGLPAPANFAALLTGEWRELGWNSIELEEHPASRISEAPRAGVIAPPGYPAANAPLGSGAVPEPFTPLEIAVAHPLPRRDQQASAEPRFVSRPEIGLWGVVCAADGGSDLISDGAHDLAPQASLTALVEETRRMLERTRNFHGRAGLLPGGVPAALFLLAQAGECALVWVGPMQAVRVRGASAVPLLADGSDGSEVPKPPELPELADAPPASHSADVEEGSLLALLTSAVPAAAVTPETPAAPHTAVRAGVRYEPLEAEDLWLLGTTAVLEENRIREVVGVSVEEARRALGPAAALEPLLSPWVGQAVAGATPAVMLLKARKSA